MEARHKRAVEEVRTALDLLYNSLVLLRACSCSAAGMQYLAAVCNTGAADAGLPEARCQLGLLVTGNVVSGGSLESPVPLSAGQ